MTLRWTLLPLGLVLAACGRDRDPLAPRPFKVDGTLAWLSVSASHVAAGDTLTVIARARPIEGPSRAVGSYRGRLDYDPVSLEYVDASGGSGMIAVNASSGSALVIAGADPGGFEDDRLFVARFRARSGGRVAGLALAIAELSGTDFGDRRPSLTVRRDLETEPDAR